MTLSPPKKSGSLDSTYDQVFFKQHEKYRDIYQHLAGLIRHYSPSSASSIVDVGCGHCLLLEALQRLFPAAYGIDGSTQGVPSHLISKVTIHDLSKPAGNAVLPKTDIVASFETAEHLPESCAESFVESLLWHAPKLVFFSAATPFQDCGQNPSHVNEKPLTYWVERFEARGYSFEPSLSLEMRSKMIDSRLYGPVAWYPKNILIFTIEQPPLFRFVSNHPRIESSNSIFQLIFDRDRLEFETLLLKRAR